MATATLTAPTPQLKLTPGMQVVFEAIDPTTGAPIAGVTVSALGIYGDDLSGTAKGQPLGTWAPLLLRRAT